MPAHFSSDPKPERIDAWHLAIPISNDGNTPTRNGKVRYTRYESPNGQSIPDDFDFPDLGDPAGPFALGPHQTVHTQYMNVPIEFIKDVLDHTGHFYLYGWATYHDAFKGTPEHITQFCYELTEVAGDPLVEGGLEADVFTLCQTKAGATLHNCFDDECKVQK